MTKILIAIMSVLMISGCATMLSYEEIIQSANSVNIADGLDKEEAALLAQKHVILSGLDQKVSVYRVGEVTLMNDTNFWLVRFNSGVDRGMSDTRQFGFSKEILIQVNRTTGTSALFSSP